jgi:hypothetical protein
VIGGETGARARWLGVLLILLALAVVAWQALVAGQAAAPAALRSAGTSQPSLHGLPGPAEGAKPGMPGASAAAPMAASAPLLPGEVELCGVGRVKADELGQPTDKEPIGVAAEHARERLLPALLNSPDDVLRAAGLLLQSLGTVGGGDVAAPANVLARDALANMATASRSPQVYAWAVRACQGHRGEGMCQLLSAEQWARLEPDNAFPWLHVATDARERHDTAAVAEAMFRLSRASRSDARWGALTATALSRLPSELSLLAKGALAAEIFEIDAGTELPVLVASQHCSVADVRDVNRQQLCLAVADVLTSQGSTLLEVVLGEAIGQRVGWPAERLAAGREERDAMAQAAEQLRPQPQQAWSFAALSQTLNSLSEVGQRGEMAALRNTLKQSPDSAAVLAQRRRQALAPHVASAASGPAAVPSR